MVNSVGGNLLTLASAFYFFFFLQLEKSSLALESHFPHGEQGLDLLISNLPAFRFSSSEICNLPNPTEKEGVT